MSFRNRLLHQEQLLTARIYPAFFSSQYFVSVRASNSRMVGLGKSHILPRAGEDHMMLRAFCQEHRGALLFCHHSEDSEEHTSASREIG